MSNDKSKFDANSKSDLRKWLKERIKDPVLERFQRLYISRESYKEFKDHYCAGCGRVKKDPHVVYGESFCGECAAKMMPGYIALKTMGGGWKQDIRKFFKK